MKENIKSLSDTFEYREESPSGLVWKDDNTGVNGRVYNKKGSAAGFIKTEGDNRPDRWMVRFNSKAYRVHRVILEIHGIKLEHDKVVDHLDGNSLNNKISNLRVISQTENTRNAKQSSANSTGVTGVSYTHRLNKHPVYVATWYEEPSKLRTKEFSTYGYGEAEAFRLACEYRKQMIAELNLQGAGYTERHGT